jgi:hypothetical protein
MSEPKIPDRSGEPAVQESPDDEKSTTAANPNDVEPDAPPDTRDDEGNLVGTPREGEVSPVRPRPDSDAGSQ